jgi:hypothetical protein
MDIMLSRYIHFLYIFFFLKLTMHSTYTEKLQINEQIKLYTVYTNTVKNNFIRLILARVVIIFDPFNPRRRPN